MLQLGLALFCMTGCFDKDDSESPCEQWVEYRCACLSIERCAELNDEYEDADPDMQEACEDKMDQARDAAERCDGD